MQVRKQINFFIVFSPLISLEIYLRSDFNIKGVEFKFTSVNMKSKFYSNQVLKLCHTTLYI